MNEEGDRRTVKDRRISPRRIDDFCAEHCILKGVYEEKFKEHREDISKKAPLWAVLSMIAILCLSAAGSWLQVGALRKEIQQELKEINKTLTVVITKEKTKEEIFNYKRGETK